MNIFASSRCPTESAQYLDDKRVVKMVLETAQILCTVIHAYDPEFHAENKLYKPTHVNHPCVKWAAEDNNNFRWLFRHYVALLKEYSARYNRGHACASLYLPLFTFGRKSLTEDEFWAPPIVTCFQNSARNKTLGIDYTNINDVHLAYRLYLEDRWARDKRKPTWYGLARSNSMILATIDAALTAAAREGGEKK